MSTRARGGARCERSNRQQALNRLGYSNIPSLSKFEAIDIARDLWAEFQRSTTAQRQGVITVQCDGSRRNSRDGGVVTICDICLPDRVKTSMEEARYMVCHANSFLPEACAVMNAYRMVKNILEDAKLPRHTHVHVNIITDCESIVTELGKNKSGQKDNARRYKLIIREIDHFAAGILECGDEISLNLFYCPRNQTGRVSLADKLAGLAADCKASFMCRIRSFNGGLGGAQVPAIYNNSEHRTTTAAMGRLAPELALLAKLYPIGSQEEAQKKGGQRPKKSNGEEHKRKDRTKETKKKEDVSSTAETLKRKIPGGHVVEASRSPSSEEQSVKHVNKKPRRLLELRKTSTAGNYQNELQNETTLQLRTFSKGKIEGNRRIESHT